MFTSVVFQETFSHKAVNQMVLLLSIASVQEFEKQGDGLGGADLKFQLLAFKACLGYMITFLFSM